MTEQDKRQPDLAKFTTSEKPQIYATLEEARAAQEENDRRLGLKPPMTAIDRRDWERARALLPVLVEVAKSGSEPMTYGGVAQMFNTGPRNINGRLLGKIDDLCDQQNLPRLRTLVVLSGDGLPSGDWAGFTTAEEKRAAQADCYRHYGAVVPESVSRLRRRSQGGTQEVYRPSCPTCYMELPATGVCDTCG